MLAMTVRQVASVIFVIASSGGALLQKPNRTAPPKPTPPSALRIPPIQKHTLSTGLPVWIIEQHEVPLAQVNLIIRAGSGADPEDKYGIASMTANMLDEGAGSKSGLELADSLEFLGAQLETTSTFDYSAVRLSVPAARLAEALPLIADVVANPTFPDDQLDRLRKERLTELLQVRDNPARIIDAAFQRLVFGEKHRYGTPAAGIATGIKAITGVDLRTFHGAHYRPANSTLVVVGDITTSTALPLLERAFSPWKSSNTDTKIAMVPAAAQLTKRQIFIIDKPGAPQSQVEIGWIGVARSTPDYATLQVLNTMLGGSFTSRLNMNLREKHGYTYGAFSRFQTRISPGTFSARAGVQTDKTAESVKEFFTEFAGILKPVPAAELGKAKNYVAFGLPAEFETSADIAQKVEEQVVYSLPEEYFSNYIRSIGEVSATAVEAAARKYIQPERFVVVIVGDRKQIEPGIRALNFGPVQSVSLDEVLGPS